jgi:hypothetical protein
MRVLVLVVAALLARPAASEACSLSGVPAAHVLQPASGKPPGRQPLISLWMVKQPVTVTRVPASCKDKTICNGTAVAVDRTGDFLRPKAALPDGARVQVTMGTTLLADVTVATGAAPPLPAWDGVTLVSAKHEKEGLCSPAGPVVRLKVKPTKASLDGAWLLVYLDKPDPKQPMTKLAFVVGLGGGDKEIELGNGLGMKPWLTAVPKQIWVTLADGEGNVGPAIRLP